MVFVAVSGSAMAGIPDEHAGMASGFMMTGHEVGAALGVAALSAIATSAGALTTASGAADAFSRGALAAAVIAAVLAAFAVVRMPATRGGRRPHAHALTRRVRGSGFLTEPSPRSARLRDPRPLFSGGWTAEPLEPGHLAGATPTSWRRR